MLSAYCGWLPSCHLSFKCLDCNPIEEYQIYLGREAINPNARPLGTFENPSEEYQIYLGREAVNPTAHPLGTFETKTSVRCSKRSI